MIEMNPKSGVKLDIVELDRFETYLEEELLPEHGLWQHEIKKDGLLNLSGVKIHID